jgi:hypothetical protein
LLHRFAFLPAFFPVTTPAVLDLAERDIIYLVTKTMLREAARWAWMACFTFWMWIFNRQCWHLIDA